MAGEAGKARTVLLATEKAFAAGAVKKIEDVCKAANYTMKKLENYKSKDDLLTAVADVDAMIIRSDIVDQAVVDKAEKLKIVVRAGAGYDNIDLKACEAKSVTAMNTPGQNANAVAELVFGMMIVSARNNFDGTSGFELVNREIAFYGFGAVARAVHKLAQGFGMKSFAYDPYIPADKIQAWSSGSIYVVLIRSSLNEKFGIRFVSLADGRMRVMSVGAGLCEAHNEEMRFYPKHSNSYQRQVIPEDYIVSVNGNSTIDKMKEHLLQSLVVHIQVARCPPALKD